MSAKAHAGEPWTYSCWHPCRHTAYHHYGHVADSAFHDFYRSTAKPGEFTTVDLTFEEKPEEVQKPVVLEKNKYPLFRPWNK